jgi:putative membrane protein
MEIIAGLKIDIWITQCIAMLITAILLPGFTVSGPLSALIAVVSLAFVNTQLWDAALFFSVPNSLTVHALTLIVANGALFWILVKILPGIDTRGIIAPLVAPIIFTVISMYLHENAKDIDWNKVWHKTKDVVVEVKEEIKKTHPSENNKDAIAKPR